MLDIRFIRDNVDLIKTNCAHRRVSVDIDRLLTLDQDRRDLQQQIDTLRAERNKGSKGKPTPEEIEHMRRVGENIKELETKLTPIEEEYTTLILSLPNLTSQDTPIGPDESGNKVLRQVGTLPTFDFQPKEHWELGKALNVIDTETAAKVSGSRFVYLKGELVLLEFALIQLAMSVLTDEKKLQEIITNACLKLPAKPFIPVLPPVMIKPDVMQRMGRLEPRDERYYIPSDDVYLIGSAEHTLGPMHADETFREEDLPMRYVGFSVAFRREAGSYAKDMKGIMRLHQFDKLEMETFSTPETGGEEQLLIVAIQEHLMQLLNLPYQVVEICTGDMGTPDYRQIDVETWLPGQNRYRETHTSDYMTDFQSRRLNTKLKRANGETILLHMNDATAFSQRPLIAIMENYQQEDGSIVVPEILRPYMGGREKIG